MEKSMTDAKTPKGDMNRAAGTTDNVHLELIRTLERLPEVSVEEIAMALDQGMKPSMGSILSTNSCPQPHPLFKS
jgi:hypothetical protein